MISKVTGFLTDTLPQQFEIRAVSNLDQELDEEADIACSVYKVSACSLMLRFPHLNRHGLSKDLLCQLMFRRSSSDEVSRISSQYVSSLI